MMEMRIQNTFLTDWSQMTGLATVEDHFFVIRVHFVLL